MGEIHAYRPTAEFIADWKENEAKRLDYIQTVVKPFDAAHPGNEVAWTRGPFNIEIHASGFLDGKLEDPAPEGLSRNKDRNYLIPARGAKGEVWRQALKEANQLPSRDKVYQKHGVPMRVEDPSGDGGFYMRPVAVQRFGDEYVVACLKPVESDVLTPMRLSEYYALKEAHEAEGVRG